MLFGATRKQVARISKKSGEEWEEVLVTAVRCISRRSRRDSFLRI
jgi:hypothetical protein